MDGERYGLKSAEESAEENAVGESASGELYARKGDKRYTYSDYLEWDDDQRWELIDGVPFLMSAPTRQHQEISGNFFVQLYTLLKGTPCKAFYAPFDVRLNADTLDNTVVQPDILVVCDRSRLDKTCCKGAPDFVVEILSPSTSSHDRFLKFDLYRKAGVREYWIVEPDIKKVSVHTLYNEDFVTRIYGEDDMAPISLLDNCTINLKEVFPLE